MATCPKDDNRKINVIWHTQDSGKSLSMVFYRSNYHASTNEKSDHCNAYL